jgi:uncharacterized protein (DUF302 family)
MEYTFHKIVDMTFDEAVEHATAELAKRGFGVLTTIDVKATLKKKRDIEFRPYTILGACNPDLAHKALLAEERIGVMLPCNVIVQERDGKVEVAAVDPIASMASVQNPSLGGIATEVQGMLREVIEAL